VLVFTVVVYASMFLITYKPDSITIQVLACQGI
jgi:hypothetical protein